MNTLGINTGNGVYDAIGLVESIVVDLDHLEVRGVANMKIIFDSIGKLDALKKTLLSQKEGAEDGRLDNNA